MDTAGGNCRESMVGGIMEAFPALLDDRSLFEGEGVLRLEYTRSIFEGVGGVSDVTKWRSGEPIGGPEHLFVTIV